MLPWIVLALLLMGLVVWWARRKEEATPPPAAIPVVTALATQQDVTTYLSGIGSVVSPHQVVVQSRIDGELMALHFKEGDTVKKGQLLATLDDRTIRATLTQAKAERIRNEALLKTAQIDLVRYRNLLKENAISAQTVDTQASQVEQLKATVAANQAVIESAGVELGYARIFSPVTGRAGIRRVDPGNLIRANDTVGIVTVTQVDPIAVIFTLSQDALPELSALPDGKAAVTVTSKEGGEALAEGELVTIDNTVDQASGTIRLKAMFENRRHGLWPGQFVVARLAGRVIKGAVVVPPAAIQRGQKGSYAFRVNGDKAEMVDVTVGLERADLTVITAGLAPGDRVVIDGQSRLKADSTVSEAKATAASSTASSEASGAAAP